MTLDNAILYSISASALTNAQTGGNTLSALAGQITAVSASRCVIAVVGASTADQHAMQRHVADLGPAADVYRRANVLTLAARENAQRVAGLVTMLGADAELLDPLACAPITRGNPLEAEPRLLHAKRYEQASASARVLVVAGGVGRTPDGHLTSLGTGGATLSGLFIAQRLGLPARIVVGENGLDTELPRRAKLFARKHGVAVDLIAGIDGAQYDPCEAVSA